MLMSLMMMQHSPTVKCFLIAICFAADRSYIFQTSSQPLDLKNDNIRSGTALLTPGIPSSNGSFIPEGATVGSQQVISTYWLDMLAMKKQQGMVENE
jgi:hypothetical protein